MVSSFTGLDSTASPDTNNNIFSFWSNPVLLNWRQAVQWSFPHFLSVFWLSMQVLNCVVVSFLFLKTQILSALEMALPNMEICSAKVADGKSGKNVNFIVQLIRSKKTDSVIWNVREFYGGWQLTMVRVAKARRATLLCPFLLYEYSSSNCINYIFSTLWCFMLRCS